VIPWTCLHFFVVFFFGRGFGLLLFGDYLIFWVSLMGLLGF
jgi:hypothetical protein